MDIIEVLLGTRYALTICMRTKLNKQVVIVDRKSNGNSFGDRTFEVTVEYRENGEVKATKTFSETAFEGEHASARYMMTYNIRVWAKEQGTRFTGSV